MRSTHTDAARGPVTVKLMCRVLYSIMMACWDFSETADQRPNAQFTGRGGELNMNVFFNLFQNFRLSEMETWNRN